MPSPISPTDTFSKFLAFFGLFLYASGLIDVWRGIEPLQNDVLIQESDTNIERAWQKIERIDKKRLNALAEELEHAKEKGDFKGKEIVAILDKIKRESYEMARKNAKLRGDHHFECGDPGAMNGPNFILNRLEKGLANSR